jgi:hypothetical protein
MVESVIGLLGALFLIALTLLVGSCIVGSIVAALGAVRLGSAAVNIRSWSMLAGGQSYGEAKGDVLASTLLRCQGLERVKARREATLSSPQPSKTRSVSAVQAGLVHQSVQR